MLALFGLFMLYPIWLTVRGGFLADPTAAGAGFTLEHVLDVFRDPALRAGLLNALWIAVATTTLCVLIALPLALLSANYRYPGKKLWNAVVLVPLILPPFVGAIGMYAVLGRFGALNSLLGLGPVDWLAEHKFWAVVVVEALHLYPIIYLNATAALANLDPALDEAADPDSNFFQRLNNPKYTRYAQTFTPDEGQIRIAPDDLAGLADQFERAAFQLAVGDVDNSMRLSLNYQSEIVDMVGIGSSDEAILFRILGSVPVRTVLEGALNLPQDMRSLDLDRQADILREQLSSKLGVRDLTDLTRLDKIDEVIKRYHAMNAIEQGPSPTTRGATALALLNSSIGVGSGASQNLFLSLLR